MTVVPGQGYLSSVGGRNTKKDRPDAREVAEFHVNADTDGSPKALHHTLGPGPNQAAVGNHTHDAGASSGLTGYAAATHTHGAQQTSIRARASANANQSLASSAVLAGVIFNVSDYDTNAIVNLAGNSLVIKTAGWYRFYLRLVFASQATGGRAGFLLKNGAIIFDSYLQANGNNVTIMQLASEPIQCAVNDIMTMQAMQASGAALNLIIGNGRYSYLACELASYT